VVELFSYLRAQVVVFLFLVFCTQFSWAGISGVFNFGYDYDGDEVEPISFVSGNTHSVAAGKGVFLNVGAVMDFDTDHRFWRDFKVQSTLGYKIDAIPKATNGSLDWSRIPVELLGFYHFRESNLRLGAGLTYQFSNELRGTGVLQRQRQFDNSLGGVIEADYLFGIKKNLLLGLRYTIIQYRAASRFVTYNANSLGLQFGFIL